MATLTKQTIVREGLEASYVTMGAGGDEFVNTGREVLHVKFSGFVPITVAISIQQIVDEEVVADKVATITNTGTDYFIGPFPRGVYNDTLEKVQLAASSIAEFPQIAVLELPED